MSALLEIRSVSAGYGLGDVLRDVSIAVPEGSTVALVGRNGAGKTTTLRVASGVVSPSRGEVVFDGHVVNGRSPEELARMGVAHVPEGRGVLRTLTVKENLHMGAYVSGKARRSLGPAIRQACERFPVLGARLNQSAGTLSGGEQQMLAVARALMKRPRLLLLDEPSLGLAPIVVTELYSIIQDLREQDLTILLVEQYVDLALRASDRAYVLGKGQIIIEGNSTDVAADGRVTSAYLAM
jgi:branched-chain amino acid transport system ATP-binding protein